MKQYEILAYDTTARTTLVARVHATHLRVALAKVSSLWDGPVEIYSARESVPDSLAELIGQGKAQSYTDFDQYSVIAGDFCPLPQPQEPSDAR
jgi:hypothetical protein